MKCTKVFAGLSGAALLVGLGLPPASAVDGRALTSHSVSSLTTSLATLESDRSHEIREALEGAGVPNEKIELLVHKFERGEQWDSLRPEAKPVQERTRELGDRVETRLEYEDGSILILTADTPRAEDGQIRERGVSGCKTAAKSNYHVRYSGCQVEANWVTHWLGFSFSYEHIKDKSPTIKWYGDKFYGGLGASYSKTKFRKVNSSTVRLSGELNFMNSVQQVNYVQVSVKSGKPVMKSGAQ